MLKISESVKNEFLEKITNFLVAEGEEVLKVKSGTISIPWAKEEEEGYINITFSIPKGARDEKGYDGYAEAENYKFLVETKNKQKEEKEKAKQKKIERDKKMREERKKKEE